jgi:hypothetical protein
LELLAEAVFPAARLGPPAAEAGKAGKAIPADASRMIAAVAASIRNRLGMVRMVFSTSRWDGDWPSATAPPGVT